jgi:hypothetical protein
MLGAFRYFGWGAVVRARIDRHPEWHVAEEAAAVTGIAAEVTESSRQPDPSKTLSRSGTGATIFTLAWYVLGGFFVTGLLWVHPTGRWQVGDIQDVDQAQWFMRYTAVAFEHFHLPALTTTAMNAPHSVNLMWNTSLLLPGMVMAPITLLFGTQASLTTLLVIGFAGSAAAMYYVLRHWRCSLIASALGGALYGFSPALVNSGIGHYSLVWAMLLPLILDRAIRILVGDGSGVRNGLWLGVLVAAQLFISEEALVDTVIAAGIILVLLIICRPRQVAERLKPSLIGLGAAAITALVLCARGLWVQFHGVATKGASATVVIQYNGRMTNLGTLPYAFVTPSNTVLVHTGASAQSAAYYPQPTPEYLAYLGVPLIILLIVAVIRFWNNLTIRVAGLTFLLLEWLGLGAKPLIAGTKTLPSFLLPWQYVQHLPVMGGMVPDRLCILADAGAAVVLAFALDRAHTVKPFANLRDGAKIAVVVAALALVPLVPAPYKSAPVRPVPVGWRSTFTALHLKSGARVLLAPFPWAGASQMMRWAGTTGEPQVMIGGDFIAPDEPGRQSRAGRSGLNAMGIYMDMLYTHTWDAAQYKPSAATIRAEVAEMDPAAVVAATKATSPMGQFLISVFGQPTTRIGHVLGWKL